MSHDLAFLFNGRPFLEMVQGEDMAIAISVREADDQSAVDLTSAEFGIGFVGVDDRKIGRSSVPFSIDASAAAAQQSNIAAYSHQLVTGDTVLTDGTGLPAPLVSGTPYPVLVVDENTINLLDSSGVPIIFTAAASAGWTIDAGGVTIAQAALGIASVLLTSNFTSNIKSGKGSTFQISLRRAGQLHIYIQCNQLDVSEQISARDEEN